MCIYFFCASVLAALLEGLDIFRPGENQLKRGKDYDEIEPLTSGQNHTLPQNNPANVNSAVTLIYILNSKLAC